jgi:DNA polymerase III subunit delta
VFSKVWKELKQKKFSPIYLLYGNENFLINKTKDLIIQEAIQEEEVEFNLSIYDLEDTPVETVIEDCETIPFFGERKIVIAHHPLFLTSEKGKDKVEHNLKIFEQYIENPVPTTILVLIAPYEKLDERKKLTKALKKHARTLQATGLSEKEIKQWIREQVSENGNEMTNDGVELLYQYVGPNLTLLHNELEKLFLYCEQQIIDDEVVHLLVAKSLEDNIFALVDQVIQRNLDKALEIYYDLLKQNEEPIKILAVIASQLRFIYEVKTLLHKGYGEKQIASILKVHPYRVKLTIPKAKNFEEKRILAMVNYLADLDYKLKSGYGNKEKLIELFFFTFLTRDNEETIRS